jgi:hypothetical protein
MNRDVQQTSLVTIVVTRGGDRKEILLSKQMSPDSMRTRENDQGFNFPNDAHHARVPQRKTLNQPSGSRIIIVNEGQWNGDCNCHGTRRKPRMRPHPIQRSVEHAATRRVVLLSPDRLIADHEQGGLPGRRRSRIWRPCPHERATPVGYKLVLAAPQAACCEQACVVGCCAHNFLITVYECDSLMRL